jgi:hypothetical protein
MPSLQQRYYDVLMERVREEKHPSHQLLDRIEASFFTPDQIVEYVEMLINKVDSTWYPSHQILNRIDRIMRAMVKAA